MSKVIIVSQAKSQVRVWPFCLTVNWYCFTLIFEVSFSSFSISFFLMSNCASIFNLSPISNFASNLPHISKVSSLTFLSYGFKQNWLIMLDLYLDKLLSYFSKCLFRCVSHHRALEEVFLWACLFYLWGYITLSRREFQNQPPLFWLSTTHWKENNTF